MGLALKIDLVMWTLNSEKTLAATLSSISFAIPDKYVNQKIIVDAHSKDSTKEIAEDFGWTVYDAKTVGVTAQANQALDLVETEIFASFEHDIILNPNWLRIVYKNILPKRIAVSQGVRIATQGLLRDLDFFRVKRLKKEERLQKDYMSLDNTLYQTDIIREQGGYPSICPICADVNLKKKLLLKNYVWTVDDSLISDHIHGTNIEYFIHRKNLSGMYTCQSFLKKVTKNVILLFNSPFRGVEIAKERRKIEMIPFYICNRIAIFLLDI